MERNTYGYGSFAFVSVKLREFRSIWATWIQQLPSRPFAIKHFLKNTSYAF